MSVSRMTLPRGDVRRGVHAARAFFLSTAIVAKCCVDCWLEFARGGTTQQGGAADTGARLSCARYLHVFDKAPSLRCRLFGVQRHRPFRLWSLHGCVFCMHITGIGILYRFTWLVYPLSSTRVMLCEPHARTHARTRRFWPPPFCFIPSPGGRSRPTRNAG